jgi:mono/diheme cytochrome c family protein
LHQHQRWSMLVCCLLLVPSILLSATRQQDGTSSPHNPIEGAKIFRSYCATCHGTDAHGNGPAAAALKHSAPDLTVISQANGGKFPYQRIKDIIEGKQTGPVAHGNREMPVWGPVFHEIEADQDWGEVRLEAVTKYLESIQKK